MQSACRSSTGIAHLLHFTSDLGPKANTSEALVTGLLFFAVGLADCIGYCGWFLRWLLKVLHQWIWAVETAAVYSRWGFLLWLWFFFVWQQSNRNPEYDRSKGLAGYDTIVLQDCAPGAPEFLASNHFSISFFLFWTGRAVLSRANCRPNSAPISIAWKLKGRKENKQEPRSDPNRKTKQLIIPITNMRGHTWQFWRHWTYWCLLSSTSGNLPIFEQKLMRPKS